MSPIRFGPEGRQLFGLFQAPRPGDERRQSVLICPPFGQEYVRCHRLLRVLADRLVREGFHVLRFDFFGTGDSDGDDVEGELQQWQQDVLSAHGELSRLSGNADTSWFGLRLGGSIAAAASIWIPTAPHKLVLWDPIADGTRYLHELEKAHFTGLGIDFQARWNREDVSQLAIESAPHEILGFPLSKDLRQQIANLALSTLTSARTGSLDIFFGKNNSDFSQLEENLRSHGTRVRIVPIVTEILWATNEAMNSAIVPAEALNGIIRSLSDAS